MPSGWICCSVRRRGSPSLACTSASSPSRAARPGSGTGLRRSSRPCWSCVPGILCSFPAFSRPRRMPGTSSAWSPGPLRTRWSSGVEARMRRQRMLGRDHPPLISVLFDENVLHRRVGGPEVMREQLNRLLEVAAHPSVFIQVVDADCLPGLAGAFMIAELPDGQPDVISSDAPAQAQITADIEIVTSIWERYEAIRLWAYPERVSREMIEKARDTWI
ncbi:MAG TPA: DUF5753 domain-containing protein [Nonomuraea sp.]|nr:DUF5753 domain-containing protein [Nonomuraea sp.]